MTPAPLQPAEAALRSGDAAGACSLLDALVGAADIDLGLRVDALKLRSRAHEALRNLGAAIADLEGVVALAPRDARAHNELGILRTDAGETGRAIECFRRAVALEPAYARAWNNLGNANRALGNAQAAEESFARAAAADPRYALAFANLGVMRRERGDDAAAEAALVRALALDPGQRVALLSLAGWRRQQGALDAAERLYAQAAERDPRDANALLLRAQTLAERDALDTARGLYDGALARDPAMLRAALGRHLSLPMVPANADAVAASRSAFVAGLAHLEADLPRRAAGVAPARVLDELRWTNFLLAYQGGDDAPLQARYGDLVRDVLAASGLPPPRAGRRTTGARVRVAFVSSFFRDGTVGRYFERWITDLARERFEVDVYHLNPARDALTDRLRARADTFHALPRARPSEVAARLRDHAPDVLVFPELGMDATTFAVAALRLAPVQCAGWGHPVTTGLATIDAFFTCAAMEPGDADAHYRERLARLPGLGTRYPFPDVPGDADRSRLGLPDGVPLLLCPQSLFKIHPDNDALFAATLARVPAARLVMFEGRHPALTAALGERLRPVLASAGVDAGARVHVLPQCQHADYLRINAACDVMLDTLHWSGGNTTLDALAAGLPVVTLPGRFMRGRQSAAMLQQGGQDAGVASGMQDYVDRVARAVDERGDADARRGRIAAARASIFDDAAPLAAFADQIEAFARAGVPPATRGPAPPPR